MKVQIAEQMKKYNNGELNNLFFKDLQFLNAKEREAFCDFIEHVSKDINLRGKNKPSWQDDFGKELSSAIRYKTLNCWHYHSGPSYCRKKCSTPVPTIKLEFNPNGDTSSEVIHYQKVGEDTIFVQAFSPKHEPFPTASNSPNPILDRAFEQKIAALKQIISDMDNGE